MIVAVPILVAAAGALAVPRLVRRRSEAVATSGATAPA